MHYPTRPRWPLVLMVLLIAALAFSVASAHAATAPISGHLRWYNGAPCGGCAITIYDGSNGTTHWASTDGNGNFSSWGTVGHYEQVYSVVNVHCQQYFTGVFSGTLGGGGQSLSMTLNYAGRGC